MAGVLTGGISYPHSCSLSLNNGSHYPSKSEVSMEPQSQENDHPPRNCPALRVEDAGHKLGLRSQIL